MLFLASVTYTVIFASLDLHCVLSISVHTIPKEFACLPIQGGTKYAEH